MRSGNQLQRQTPRLLVRHVVARDPRAARKVPCERNAGGVEGGEAQVGGWDDQS